MDRGEGEHRGLGTINGRASGEGWVRQGPSLGHSGAGFVSVRSAAGGGDALCVTEEEAGC